MNLEVLVVQDEVCMARDGDPEGGFSSHPPAPFLILPTHNSVSLSTGDVVSATKVMLCLLK